MREAFQMGGWGMYPTLVIGVLMIGAAVWYAIRPEKRYFPLLVSFGLMTFISGCLGFVTGVIKSFMYIGQVGPDERYIALIGVAESLCNVVFALVLIMLAVIASTVGAWRIARMVPAGEQVRNEAPS